MIERGFLGLFCDGECSDDEYQEPAFLEDGFQYDSDLRKYAAERGWIHVKPPGRPWGDGDDYCPNCAPAHQAAPKPENTQEVRG